MATVQPLADLGKLIVTMASGSTDIGFGAFAFYPAGEHPFRVASHGYSIKPAASAVAHHPLVRHPCR